MRAKLFQSCPTLCDPMNYSPPCSSVHGILQARIWESRLPCPSPGDLPEPGIKPRSLMSPALASRFFTASTTGKPPFLVQKQDLRFFFPIFSSQWFHWGQGKEKEQCDQRKEKGLLRFVIQPCVICYKRHELLSWLKFQCFKKIKVISSDNINFPYDTPSLVVQFTLNTSSNGNSQTLEAIHPMFGQLYQKNLHITQFKICLCVASAHGLGSVCLLGPKGHIPSCFPLDTWRPQTSSDTKHSITLLAYLFFWFKYFLGLMRRMLKDDRTGYVL